MSRHVKKRRRKAGTAAAAVAAALIIIVLAFALAVTYGGRIFPNVYVDGIAVGGMTGEKAVRALEDGGWAERTGRVLTVRTYRGAAVEVDPVEAGIVPDARGAAAAAMRYGRGRSIIQNMLSFFRSLDASEDVMDAAVSENGAYISARADALQSALGDALGDMYEIDEDNAELVLVKGQSGLYLNTAELASEIGAALRSGQTELVFTGLLLDPLRPDFSLIHNMVCGEAEDARFADDGAHEIIGGRPGYSFETEDAERLWDAALPGESVRVPLRVSYSTVTEEYLESMMFRDLLGAVTTKYNNSGANRCSNVRLAASKIDGKVLYPGEEFSFNETVGARTADAGFLLAPAYAGYDDIKEEIGGGVCQVSTGVYAAALFAFMDITKHTCHVYPPNYIQLGTDATVTIPEGGGRTIDLRFRNCKSCPVMIKAYCEETEDRGDGKPLRTVTVEIWGTLEADDYMPVEFDNSWGDVYDYDRVIEPAYPDREGYKLKLTHDEQEFEDDTGKGLRTITYRRVYDSSGTVVEKKALNPTYSAGYAMDTYYYMG